MDAMSMSMTTITVLALLVLFSVSIILHSGTVVHPRGQQLAPVGATTWSFHIYIFTARIHS